MSSRDCFPPLLLSSDVFSRVLSPMTILGLRSQDVVLPRGPTELRNGGNTMERFKERMNGENVGG